MYYYPQYDTIECRQFKYVNNPNIFSGGIHRIDGVRVFTEIYEDDYNNQYEIWKQMQDGLRKPYK